MKFLIMNCTIICSFLLYVTLLSCTNFSLVWSESNLLGNETDRLALLAFKNGITNDPLAALASWNQTLHFCQWNGVSCSAQQVQRVIALNLTGQSVSGILSPHITNLTFLSTIDLTDNYFHGVIPPQIGYLLQLQQIYLRNNSFEGEIPTNITHCSELRVIDFTLNMLVGRIPVELTSLSKLVILYLSANNLTSTIPPSLGNLTSLTNLSLTRNSLEGSIPYDLGKMTSLEYIQISGNRLSGTIPPSLYNLSSIYYISVANNLLGGSLPAELGGIYLPNLQVLLGGANLFRGPIPISLGNASGLVQLDFTGNYLTGSVPVSLGSLQHLWYLGLAENELGSKTGDDLSIITSLTNCSSLQVLGLANNVLNGVLPNSIANLSTQLMNLRLGVNLITGSIPTGIENLISLNFLGLQGNFLTGTIPIGIGKLNKLDTLNLVSNSLSGGIPSSIGNITRLSRLYLLQNGLEGSIPSSLGNCSYLQELALQENKINGTIPKEILTPSSLFYLNVSHNSLFGSVPLEVGNLNNLQLLDISNNKLSDEIPSTLGGCIALVYLYMDTNFFQGSIPLSLRALGGIQELDLSSNNLSGQIPVFLEKFSLQYLNLSFNDLEGEVPKEGIFKNGNGVSVLGNSKLCGGTTILNLPPCPSQVSNGRGRYSQLKVIIPIVILVLCLIMFTYLVGFLCWRRNLGKKLAPSTFPMEDQSLKVSYGELLKATGGFSSANLIGEGSYGSVYKGILDPNGTNVAVKVLKLQKQGASKSFMAECKALRSIRHRNLVKIRTACSSIDFNGNDFKALVFEFIPNGSLEMWLHPNGDGQHQMGSLGLALRLNIAIDVAAALDYLHYQCQMPIIHRDLKPSNVLLDDDMNGRVGDFGLARFLSEDATNSSEIGSKTIGIKGSIGYIAPEYGMGGKASTSGDIYSYGILLLEMFTGKRPTDDMFKDGLSLHQFAKMALPERVMEIADPQFLLEEDDEDIDIRKNCSNERSRIHNCLVSVVRIGVLCSNESPRERMDMSDVVEEMHAIRELYLGDKINQDKQIWTLK
ncbi:LRR receptor-like serine/threonine-protein kinase EFR [Tasmannia lanceolata]|uniref:LRR receptor-like serine/threonine-protein kinase EFR n=1 Tax=Tasmannia lanceolata TaxID=3420 RepID=UPI0040641A12